MELVLEPVRTLAGAFSSITQFTLPEEVTSGEEIPFSVAGHLDSIPSPDWPNFAVGFFYISGPMAEITIVVDGQSFPTAPGKGVAGYVEPRPGVCRTISLACKIETLDVGSYSFVAVTGHVDHEEKILYSDDSVERLTESAEAVKPLPWKWIALGGGIAVVAVVSIVLVTRRR